jgi:hypothetical protein
MSGLSGREEGGERLARAVRAAGGRLTVPAADVTAALGWHQKRFDNPGMLRYVEGGLRAVGLRIVDSDGDAVVLATARPSSDPPVLNALALSEIPLHGDLGVARTSGWGRPAPRP